MNRLVITWAVVIPLLLVVVVGTVKATTTTTTNIPIEINKIADTSQNTMKITNPHFYLNKTDTKYHIAGTATNIIHATISSPVIGVILYDKTTGSPINLALPSATLSQQLDPGKSGTFDIPTTYTPAQANQFRYMTVAFVT